MTFETVKDYEDLLARYNAFDGYASQLIIMMRSAVSQGMVNSNASMNTVLDQINAHLVDPLETVFYEPFYKIEGLLTSNNFNNGDIHVTCINVVVGAEEEQITLRAEALLAIEFSVQAGFQKIKDFLEAEYLPNLRPDIAVSSLPGIGEDFYAQCLKFHTSTNMTVNDIHELGLAEVDRIESEMRLIVEELGYDNLTLQQFTEMIRNDPNNYYDTPEALLDGFKDILENRVNPQLLTLFLDTPEAELIIQGVPESAANGPAAFYIAGSLDGKRPGTFFVNTYKYNSQPKYEMVSLSMHEGNPGHHFQASYQLEQEEFPTFRKVMEDRIYSQSPSRFPINTAYVEGWGLYSETLGFDLNLYSDPMDRFGHLRYLNHMTDTIFSFD